MQVKVRQAKTKLSKLHEAAERSEKVVIVRGQTPVAELIPIRKKRFKLGILADELKGPVPDFLDPMSEEDLRLWEGDG